MLSVEMLPAGHGDALVIEYGSRGRAYRLLVDAGTVWSYEEMRARLLAMPSTAYQAFIITHVDEDHIGGAVPLLRDPDLRSRVANVWFNGYVHCEGGGDVLGPVDGERLTLLIAQGGLKWNIPFSPHMSASVGGPVVVPHQGGLPGIRLDGGAVLHLLSPPPAALKAMTGFWQATVTAAHLVPGMGTDRAGRSLGPRPRRVPPPPHA